MNLIILDKICEPPTESLPLRYLTMVASENLELSVLVETDKKNLDRYYYDLTNKGLMDYVDDLIIIGHSEDGIRIDKNHDYPKTIVVDSVRFENVIGLVGQIKFLTSLKY